MSLLRTVDLSRSFGSLLATDCVNLAIEAGEQRDHFVEDARLLARDRAPERAERGDRAFDLLASVRCHVDSK